MVAIISNFLSVEQIFLFDVCISREMATNRKMDNNPHLSILLLSMIYFHRKFSIKWRLIKLFLNILSILFTIPDKTFKISTKLFYSIYLQSYKMPECDKYSASRFMMKPTDPYFTTKQTYGRDFYFPFPF